MSSERPAYYVEIDRLLQEREPVADFVEAGLRDIGGRQLRCFKKDLQLLRNASQAEQLLASPHSMRLLPLLNSWFKRDQNSLIENTQTLITEETKVSSGWGRSISYPSFMFIAICALYILQAFLLSPTFEKMYEEFGLRLPSLTKMVLGLNQLTRSYAWVVVPAILSIPFVGILIRMQLSRWVAGLQRMYVLDWLLAGRSSNLIAMSRFMRVLADLHEIGTPLPMAVRHAGVASEHALYRVRSQQLSESIQSSSAGKEIWSAFPPHLFLAVSRLDQPDRTARLLRELSETYTNQAALLGANRTDITSPWFVFLLGGMTGLLMIALFLPLLGLITNLSGGY